jgi:urea transporter/NAD-dependent SIR2 family protein deacetylase
VQHLARLHVELTRHARATLRGCAQLAFCDSLAAGVLVLGGIALVSPYSGLGALLGAALGTIVGRFVPAYSRDEWSWGLASFNPAIVGLFFGGFLASGESHPAFLVPIVAGTVLLDAGFRRALARVMLPALSAAAVTTLYTVSTVAAPPGGWFWTDAPASPLVPFGALGACCIVAALIMQSRFAGLWAMLLSTITVLACWLTGHDPRATLGLWAITVPLASFGVHAIFLRGSLVGCAAGTLAALLGALAWIAWEASFLHEWLPPLLVPFILGTWLAMILMRRAMSSPLAGPAFWRAARALLAARAAGRDVAMLLAGGATRNPGPSPYFCGAWLGTELPRFAYEGESLRASARCRRAFWEACARARKEVDHLQASELAHRAARLQRTGWAHTTIVSDPLFPARDALPEDAVRLHGDVRVTRCMDCGALGSWPPQGTWRRCDLRCARCQGPVLPAVTPFGAPVDEASSGRLRDLAAQCAAILVLGEPAGEPETRRFLENARHAGAAVISVSGQPEGDRPPSPDIDVRMSPERFLAWVDVVLAVGYAVSGMWIGGDARRYLRGAGGKRRHEATV